MSDGLIEITVLCHQPPCFSYNVSVRRKEVRNMGCCNNWIFILIIILLFSECGCGFGCGCGCSNNNGSFLNNNGCGC